jgi:SAM-dependent methyltransferase
MSLPTTTWGIGEYELMAERLRPAAEVAADSVGVGSGTRLLDVACGTGNLALAAAERGAVATGLDLEERLLQIARSRGGGQTTWRRSELLELDAESAAFDVVGSIFGAMYAADHEAAAAELARVCAPDGRVVSAAWTPDSFMPAFGRVASRFLPPPPSGAQPPSRWGEETALSEIFASAALRIESTGDETIELRFTDRGAATDFLIRTAGNVLAERRGLEQGGRWEELRRAVAELVCERDSSEGEQVLLTLSYLLAIATK